MADVTLPAGETEFVNTDAAHRVWNKLSALDGKTLELDPGERAVLALPADFVDAYLKPVNGSKPKPTEEEVEAAEAAKAAEAAEAEAKIKAAADKAAAEKQVPADPTHKEPQQ